MQRTAVSQRAYRHYVAIYRCDVVTSSPFSLALGGLKLEFFRENRTYKPDKHRNMIIPAVLGAEYSSPAYPPIVLDDRSSHLVLTTRTRLDPLEGQPKCERKIDKVVAVLTAIVSPDLVRILLFRGWLKGPPKQILGPLVRGALPIEMDPRSLRRDFRAAAGAFAREPELRKRFYLMFRFIAKGFAEPPGEEAFIWLWTALEVYPMVNTSDIRPISNFLAPYFDRPPNVVKQALRVGWLFGMRSKLVHDGHLPLEEDGKFTALDQLERLVTAVLRHAAGLLYDGTFDHELEKFTVSA